MKISERLVKLRDKAGLTQLEFAERIGVKRARYNAWEQDISEPNIEMIAKIADFYKVSVDFLVGKSEMSNAEVDRKLTLDPDVRVIQRAALEMSPEQRKEALKMWDFLFKDVISNAKKQEGVDGNGEEE